MANTDILELPVAVSIDGNEWSPLVQGGTTKRVQTGLYMAGSGSSSVQDANTFLGGPTSGAAAVPTFRLLVSDDIQSALDGLSSTQGAVLYRGASDWAALAPGTSGYVLSTQGAGANPQWVTNTAGSVTSVALALPSSVFSISGSPVTSAGTLTGSFINQTANTAFLGPTTGAAAAPAFRTLVAADLPQGTSGYALIGNGASAPSYQGFLQNGSGAVTRTWNSKVAEAVSIVDFGAVEGGVTDSGAAINAALASGAGTVFVPHGIWRSSVTIEVPIGVTLIGQSFIPGAPPIGTRITVDAGVTPAMTLGNGLNNVPVVVKSLTVMRAGGAPTADKVGIFFDTPYNSILEDVQVWNHGVGFHVYADPSIGAGISTMWTRTYAGAISDAYCVIENFPETRLSQGRWGSNGSLDYAANTMFRIKGGVASTAGGPNSLVVQNMQFNQGDAAFAPAHWISFEDLTSPGVPSVDAQIWMFTNCHVENFSDDLIISDASWNVIQKLKIVGCTFNAPAESFLGLNAASQIDDWYIAGTDFLNADFTINSTPQVNKLKLEGNQFSGTVSITGGSTGGSASIVANQFADSLTVAGQWGALGLSANAYLGATGLINSATGKVSITEPQNGLSTRSSAATGTAALPIIIDHNVTSNYVRQRIKNSASANNSSAGLVLETGVSNSYSTWELSNGVASPVLQLYIGSGVTSGYLITGDAATIPVQIGTVGSATGQLKLANGGVGGALATIQNPSATVAYNFNLPTAAGTAGQPLLSGGGGSTAQTYGTLGVAAGGTAATSFTAYAVLCGGTTGTGAFQSIASVGTTGQLLTSNGAGALPTFQTASSAIGQALTRTDDTNVTLTLGGSPTTALLSATSLTLGWTGQLGLSRGGTNANLSATGGASQVLRQSSAGAAITVSQLAASDLSNGTTGSGAVALATSPSFTTPNIGAASGSTLALSSPTTSAHNVLTASATVSGDYVRATLSNASTANNSQVQYGIQTGVSNAYAFFGINNSAATPFGYFETGSGLVNGFYILLSAGSFTVTGGGTVVDSLRIQQTPSAIGTGVKTISNGADSSTNFGHYLSLNMNGTTYYIPCSAVAPT